MLKRSTPIVHVDRHTGKDIGAKAALWQKAAARLRAWLQNTMTAIRLPSPPDCA